MWVFMVWKLAKLGENFLHYQEKPDNLFEVIRQTCCTTWQGPANWWRIVPARLVLPEVIGLDRLERLYRAATNLDPAARPFTVQCGALRKYPKATLYDPRWNSLKPDVVLPHGRYRVELWLPKQFYESFPHLLPELRAIDPVHAWRGARGREISVVPPGKLKPRIDAAELARREEIKRMRAEGEEAVKADLARAKEFEAEEHKADVAARRREREKKWAADKAAREDADAARKRAIAKNPTLKWKHARRPGWKPDEDYARGGRRRNKKKA